MNFLVFVRIGVFIGVIGVFFASLLFIPTDFSLFLFSDNNEKYLDMSKAKIVQQIKGAESFIEDDEGIIYATLWDGTIKKILLDGTTGPVARIGYNARERCKTNTEGVSKILEKKCSRPLGITIYNKSLYIADAWKGILKVDLTIDLTEDDHEIINNKCDENGMNIYNDTLENKENNNIQNNDENIERIPNNHHENDCFHPKYTENTSNVFIVTNQDQFGNEIFFADGIEIDKQHKYLYFTTLGANFGVDMFAFGLFEKQFTGALYRYSFETKNTELLAKNLVLPNGLALSFDGKFMLMIEGCDSVKKFDIADTNEVKIEKFVTDTQLMADNIKRSSRRNTYLIAGDAEKSLLFYFIQNYPSVREFFRTFLPISVHSIILGLIPSKWKVIEFDENGRILQTLVADPNSKMSIKSVSEGYFSSKQNKLYLGSYSQNEPLVIVPFESVFLFFY